MPGALEKLCHGVRAISPGMEIHFTPSESEPEKWAVLIVANGAIIVNTDYDVVEKSVEQALRKLANISARMMAAVRPSPLPMSPDTEKEKERE